MGHVVASAVVSLDGFVADPKDDVGPLFDWYGNGPVEVYGADPGRPFKVSQASADYINATWPKVGVCVIGRRLFDITNGWDGVPAVGEHTSGQVLLKNPQVVQGDRVTHLHYRVRR